ncbi:ABC transporter ATP-binding protein [Mangrovitalea sediminis]|uniref:ABC transporter ATP-binding protein n=1 Tax=Mangrovitalea sediminis TaxID=1982043 RepID=UPI000BE528D8|nr:ATP-binding cassette domain-containing protein [Mangrovitalea sediminis]
MNERYSDTPDGALLQASELTHQVVVEQHTLTILQGVNLEIKAGESVAIVGRSGSGKTTLLGLLAGLDVPSEGTVILAGSELTRLSEDERATLRSRYVGFVFQSFQLLPALTALENVQLPLELRGDKDAEKRARQLLERVGLGDRLSHRPRQLSGGEQQRVAIARAFASDPRILFADEPTGNLDTETGAEIVELLMTLNREEGTTLVLVTHDTQLAARCSRQLRMEAGRLGAVPVEVSA